MRVCLVDIDALSDMRSPALPECGPQQFSLMLWPALKQFYALIPYTRDDPETLQYWLDREGFIGAIKNCVAAERLSETITKLRSQGNDVQLLLTPKISDLQDGYAEGVHALLTVSPTYWRSEWTAEHDPSPKDWAQMVDAVEKKRIELAADRRITEVLN